MNTISHLKHLSKAEVSAYFCKETSKACPAHAKISWMNHYLQAGGIIPNKGDYEIATNIAALLRENRARKMEKYSTQPANIHELAKKTIELLKEPGLAIDLGGGNSSLAICLLQKKWKVIVVDPSEQGLQLLYMRAHALGLGSIAKANLRLVPQKMENFTFPSNVNFISAQASLQYCDASKVEMVWDNIHRSLTNGGYFAADLFNHSIGDDSVGPCKELVCRMGLGAWMTTPSVTYSLLKNSLYDIDYFAIDDNITDFIGRK